MLAELPKFSEPREAGAASGTELFTVNIIVFTPQGYTHTAGEYGEWMEEAGFEAFKVAPVLGRGTHLVLARSPVVD